MSDNSIESLAKRLKKALGEVDWMGRKPRPALRGPATAEEIEAYEKKTGVTLPASYKAFLAIHNGMEGAEQYDWVVAGVTPVKKGESFRDAQSGHRTMYEMQDEDHPAVAALDASVVVGTDFDYQIAFFEPSMLDDAEPKVRRIAYEMDYDEYPLFEDFRQFLEFVVTIYEDLVDMQSVSGMDDFDQSDDLKMLEALLGDVGPSKKATTSTSKSGARSSGGGDDMGGLESLLSGLLAPEPEPEPEPELSPEMQRAANLCHIVIQKLLDAEMLEIVEAPSMRENLEDYLLRKLMRSKSPQDAMESWIYALGKAREVEELYGTDDELLALMTEAFEEIS